MRACECVRRVRARERRRVRVTETQRRARVTDTDQDHPASASLGCLRHRKQDRRDAGLIGHHLRGERPRQDKCSPVVCAHEGARVRGEGRAGGRAGGRVLLRAADGGCVLQREGRGGGRAPACRPRSRTCRGGCRAASHRPKSHRRLSGGCRGFQPSIRAVGERRAC